MSLMRRVFLWVREVGSEAVKVDLAEMAHPVEVPLELFPEDLLSKLQPGLKLSARANRTRMESKLVIAGPFEIAPAEVRVDRTLTVVTDCNPANHVNSNLIWVDVYTCEGCKREFCETCAPAKGGKCLECYERAEATGDAAA